MIIGTPPSRRGVIDPCQHQDRHASSEVGDFFRSLQFTTIDTVATTTVNAA